MAVCDPILADFTHAIDGFAHLSFALHRSSSASVIAVVQHGLVIRGERQARSKPEQILRSLLMSGGLPDTVHGVLHAHDHWAFEFDKIGGFCDIDLHDSKAWSVDLSRCGAFQLSRTWRFQNTDS